MSHQQFWETVGQWEQYFNAKESDMGFKVHEMKESKFLKKEDVGAGVLVTISAIDRQNVAKEGAEPEFKFCAHFQEMDKPLVLNQTNIQLIQMACGGGEDTDDWIGHKIVLYHDPNVGYAGKITGGIRVRKPKQAVQQAIEASKAALRPKVSNLEDLAEDLPEDLPF